MDIWQILMMPFSWLLKTMCIVFNSYGIALIVFTLVVKIILFPLSLKGKKSMIKMNLLNGQMKEIQQRCGNDRERYNQEVQKLYQENNVSPLGGCGWSLIPLAILMPLYAIIRRPLKYLMGLTDAGTTAVANALGMEGFIAGSGFGELTLAAQMNAGNLATAKEAVTAAGLSAGSMFVINFNFLGLDLARIPSLNFWQGGFSWDTFGLFLLPIISACLSLLSMFVSQRTNQMNANQQTNGSMRSMMIISPLISLWIGFTLPAGLCVYWIANSLFMIVQEIICGKMLKKDYEAAQREMEAAALRAKEAEKERRRQAAQRKAEALAANKGKKHQSKEKKNKGVDVTASREGMRTYARGRSYDPNRYPVTPYVDPNPVRHTVEEDVEPEQEVVEDKPAASAIPPVFTAPVEPVEAQEPDVEQEGDYEEAYAPESEDQNPKG